MYWLRRASILLAAVLLLASAIAVFVPRFLDPTSHGPARRARDNLWVSSSPYFFDRQFCRWLSLCGLHHLRRDPAALPLSNDEDPDNEPDDEVWNELRKRYTAPPRSWEDIPTEGDSESSRRKEADKKRNPRERRRILKDIPDYVIKHAPLVHLYSGEQFWPSDIQEHVEHMTAYIDDEFLNISNRQWNLNNLHHINRYEGKATLHSVEDVETRPPWLHSPENVPNPFDDDGDDGGDNDNSRNHYGEKEDLPSLRRERTSWFDVDKDHPLHRISDPRPRSPQGHQRRFQSGEPRIHRRGYKPDGEGYSRAPAVLVVVDKGSGIVDAFWFFFYSYNLGQTVLGIRFGNHVGDWEHCMVRFESGIPRGIYFSEHEGGQAYAWQAVEKRGVRPVIYSAVGSHAMYATSGDHPYVLPFRLLKDVTDKGPLWDPSLNNYAYHYDYTLGTDVDAPEDEAIHEKRAAPSLVPASTNPHAPTSWFHFNGAWGDELYSLADFRQWRLFGQYHYVTGPWGPKYKQLDRAKVCQRTQCRILYKLDPKGTWY